MRVLMLSWEYPPHVVGGLGKHVSDLVPALAEAGIDVHVVTPNLGNGRPEECVHSNATIHRVTMPELGRPDGWPVTYAQTCNSRLERKARELLARIGGFDLIHAHEWSVAYSAVALKYAGCLPLVVTLHATERGRGLGLLRSGEALAINGTEWWLSFEAWRVITVSQFMATQINQHFDIPAGKIDVVPNGVRPPPSRRLVGEEARVFRRRFAHDEEQIVYSVGRIVYEKGLHLLIDAAPSILAAHGPTKFVIAGAGDQLDALRRLAGERGVHDQFYFTGFVSDADRDGLFEVADVAVFPSVYEPFGIVALEAMAFGCPVVVAASGGLREVVRLHQTGLTAHPNDPASLTWAIVDTLRHPDWARTRAENALRDVDRYYQWDIIVQQTIKVYQRVKTEWQCSAWAAVGAGQVV